MLNTIKLFSMNKIPIYFVVDKIEAFGPNQIKEGCVWVSTTSGEVWEVEGSPEELNTKLCLPSAADFLKNHR